MLKQSYFRGYSYNDKEDQSSSKVPSITTMVLLQVQASIIQLLTQLPSQSKYTTTLQKASSLSLFERKRRQLVLSVQFSLYQCLHWFLLVILFLLDIVARFLNVEHEMADITNTRKQQQDTKYTPYHHHIEEQKTIDLSTNGDSEPALPTIVKNSLVSPSSPVHSPTPNFVVRQRKSSNNDESRGRHTRSLSNNMVDQRKSMSPQKLRRITAQREITVQNAVLPIVQSKASSTTSKHHHHHKRLSPNSSTSSSTTTTTERPRMQKTMSLSTAQQHHNECKKITKAYERCCPACTSH